MKRILVTGGTGFIGSHICRQLISEGYLPVVVMRATSDTGMLHDVWEQLEAHVCPLDDTATLKDVLQQCDAVIHCAALLSMNASDSRDMYHTNVELTRSLVNLALDANVRRFVHISSVAAFGYPKPGIIVDESYIPVNDNNIGAYGESKLLGELEVRRAEAEGLEVVILSPSFVLGAGDWDRGTPSLFKRLYHASVPFYPSGRQGFVDVRDVAQAAVRSLVLDVAGEKFIISAENLYWKDVISMIREAFGKKPPKKEIPGWLIGPAGWFGDIYSSISGHPVSFNSGMLRSLSYDRRFDNSKSKELLGLEYTPINRTVKQVSDAY